MKEVRLRTHVRPLLFFLAAAADTCASTPQSRHDTRGYTRAHTLFFGMCGHKRTHADTRRHKRTQAGYTRVHMSLVAYNKTTCRHGLLQFKKQGCACKLQSLSSSAHKMNKSVFHAIYAFQTWQLPRQICRAVLAHGCCLCKFRKTSPKKIPPRPKKKQGPKR